MTNPNGFPHITTSAKNYEKNTARALLVIWVSPTNRHFKREHYDPPLR